MDKNERDILVKIINRFHGKMTKNAYSTEKWDGFMRSIYSMPAVKKTRVFNFALPQFRFAYVSAGAFAAVMLMLFVTIAPSNPVLSGVTGTVKIFSVASNSWRLAEGRNIRLAKNDIVKTFSDGQADIEVKGFYQIRVKENAEMTLAKVDSRFMPGEIRYSLAKGKAYAYLKKSKYRKSKLLIDTPDSVVSALGTNFMVEASPLYKMTRVGVLDGIVKVQGLTKDVLPEKGDTVLVSAGEGTIVKRGEKPEEPHRLIDYELLELEELYAIGTKPQVALLISSGKGRTRELLSGTPIYISSEKKHEIAGSLRQIAKDMNQAIKEKNTAKRLESVREMEKMVDLYPNAKYDIQFLLFAGSCYEYLGAHESAVAAFQKVLDRYPRSPLASIAQYAIGIIYDEKLNNKDASKIAYKKVLNDYPLSPEAEELRISVKR